MSRSDPLTILEHARRHCVETMPLHTEAQRRAYLFTMETFQRAFWDIVKATAQWRNSNMREVES